jgi:hypothetical protein
MSKTRLALSHVVYFTRSLRRRRVRTLILTLSVAFVYTLLIIPFSLRRWHRAEVAADDESIAHLPHPKVFIAAMLANCAPLLSQHWIPSLLNLVDKLGPDNVFVSILENGSVDESRELLLNLETNLTSRGVPYSIRYEEDFRDGVTFQQDGLLNRILGKEGTRDNWIQTDQGWFPRRISYLAELRNMVLEPIKDSTRQFDKILFINDVIFTVPSAVFICLMFRLRTQFACYIRTKEIMLQRVVWITANHIYSMIPLSFEIKMETLQLHLSTLSSHEVKLDGNSSPEAPKFQ